MSMRVPYKWLKQFCDVPCSASELAERLTLAGVAVDAVEPGTSGHGVCAARVLSKTTHPSNDKLFVVEMCAGSRCYQVVTGWQGVEVGQNLAFAPPGAVLPRGWKIEEAKFGGVVSQGMLCALREMLLGEPHAEDEGVLVLHDDIAPGQDLYEYFELNDEVLELDLTPNYGHCLSMIGVAREAAAIFGLPVKQPDVSVCESDVPTEGDVSISIKSPDLCPRYVARLVSNVKVGQSPAWLQARLVLAGMRPISNVVDITNYVMLTLGQPLHAFDYDTIRGKQIIVDRARDTADFTTLDNQRRELEPEMLLIRDSEGAVAIAGVMGGLDSEVVASTTNVLIESALFEPRSIRRTATRLGLRSEASMRFERGVDPRGQIEAANLAAKLMCEIAGGVARKGVVDCDHSGYVEKRILLEPKRVSRVLGLGISAEQIVDTLERLAFATQIRGDVIEVGVPSRRVDIEQQIDLVEEVGRVFGYEHIPAELPSGVAFGLRTPAQIAARQIRCVMVGLGLEQVINMTFISPRDFEKCSMGSPEQRGALRLSNPMAEEQSVMRQSLLPGLLGTVSYNLARKNSDLALFEYGTVFLPSGEKLPDERQYLALVACGVPGGRHWQETGLQADFFYAKGVLEQLVEKICGSRALLEYRPSSLETLHPYRQASVDLSIGDIRESIGYVGEVAPDVAERYGITERVACIEIDTRHLVDTFPLYPDVRQIPRYPSVGRDVSFVVPDEVPAAEVENAIMREAGQLLSSVTLFDVYTGQGVPAGSRSLAYSLVYRSAERTLTDEEVDELHLRVRTEVSAKLGLVVR